MDEDIENESIEDDQKTIYQREVFNVILDSVVGDMSVRFESVHSMFKSFSVLWSSKEMTIDQIQEKTTSLVKRYPKD